MVVRWKAFDQRGFEGLELSTIISISPVNTAPHSGQIESLWWIRRGLELSTEPSTPPVNTVPRGGQSESFWGRRWSLHQNPLYMNKECQRTPTLHKQPGASTQGWFQSPEVPFLSGTSSTALSVFWVYKTRPQSCLWHAVLVEIGQNGFHFLKKKEREKKKVLCVKMCGLPEHWL